ncbi:unnamed protein product [Closterium sp. NIES-53]
MPLQAPDCLVQLSHSSSASLRGRSQHRRQQHGELVRCIQASLARTVAERLWRDHRERRMGKDLYQQQSMETLGKTVELTESRLRNTSVRRLKCLHQELERLISCILSRPRDTTRGHELHPCNRRKRR